MRQSAAIRPRLHQLRVRELQIVLADLNLPRSGRKQELIERIALALEQFEAKAADPALTTSRFYADQLRLGLQSIETQWRLSRPTYHNASPPPPPPPPPSASSSSSSVPQHRRFGSNTSGYTTPPHAQQHHHHQHHPQHAPLSQGHYRNGHGPLPHIGNNGMPVTTTPSSGCHEILHPTKPASLGGARCFCGHNGNGNGSGDGPSGKIVKCEQCGLLVHAKCHQLVTASEDEWYCEGCRAELYDPFLRVVKTILPASFVRFTKSLTPYRIEYVLTDKDLNDLYAQRDKQQGQMTPGCYELQLRCFAVKEELATGTSWPTTSQVSVNAFPLNLIQRAPPGQSNPSKVLREQPVNVFQCSRIGRNVVEVRSHESPVIFAFMVQIVEFRNITELIDEVKMASANITYEDAKQDVIKSFGGEDEDDIETTCTMLSVRCPLGLCVISLPARGVHCKHLQCFDLRTFLQFNKKARSRHYRCTVCHNFIKTTDLRIDPYLKKLLSEVEGDEELEEVEISPDASWKRRIADDGVPSPPQKKVKTESTETPSASTTTPSTITTATTSASGTPGSSANAPVEIDLSLSSDEEDDAEPSTNATTTTSTSTRPPTTSAPASNPPSQTTTATQPSQTTSATLSDDEVAVLTVDSDVWETCPPGTSATTQSLSSLGTPENGLLAFPLDDALFASFPGSSGGNPVDLSNVTSIYDYSMPSTSVENPYAAPMTWNASTSSSTTTSSGPAPAEADLASAMAILSRNHPQVTNPFARRPPPSVPPPKPSRTIPGSTDDDVLDVICLLDSDSD